VSGERLATALARVLHLKSSFGLLTPQATRRVEAWRAERLTGSLAFQSEGNAQSDGIDGRFFPAPVGVGPATLGIGPGFTITDEEGIMLYRDFVNFGGAARLGRPLSRRFALGNDVVQLLEGGLLRWRPEYGACDLYDGFDLMGAAGVDHATVMEWLESNDWGQGVADADLPPDVLPTDDPLLGAPTGPATQRNGWVVRPYVRGIARTNLIHLPFSRPTAPGGTPTVSTERVMVGAIARALEAFPRDALSPLPWTSAVPRTSVNSMFTPPRP
jgi:hypothetical protein